MCGGVYTPGVFSWPAPCVQGLERLWPQSRQSEFGSCPSSAAGAALHTVGGVASGLSTELSLPVQDLAQSVGGLLRAFALFLGLPRGSDPIFLGGAVTTQG